MLRLAGGAALAAVPALRLAGEASAARAWCRADPSFLVDDLVGNVYVSGQVDKTYDVTGPIYLLFTVPVGTSVSLIASDDGFGQGYSIGYNEDAKLKNDDKHIDITVDVYVSTATSNLPVRVEFVPDGTVDVADRKDGASNKKIHVKTQLKKPKKPKGDKDA